MSHEPSTLLEGDVPTIFTPEHLSNIQIAKTIGMNLPLSVHAWEEYATQLPHYTGTQDLLLTDKSGAPNTPYSFYRITGKNENGFLLIERCDMAGNLLDAPPIPVSKDSPHFTQIIIGAGNTPLWSGGVTEAMYQVESTYETERVQFRGAHPPNENLRQMQIALQERIKPISFDDIHDYLETIPAEDEGKGLTDLLSRIILFDSTRAQTGHLQQRWLVRAMNKTHVWLKPCDPFGREYSEIPMVKVEKNNVHFTGFSIASYRLPETSPPLSLREYNHRIEYAQAQGKPDPTLTFSERIYFSNHTLPLGFGNSWPKQPVQNSDSRHPWGKHRSK